ncbi:semaphorin-4E [Osmerus eperlanus]|uniref:semaphorin-4E n=1 Tax=Osmerus eperlanus TaxID=29151 RepID=UPI002E12EBA8
MSALWPLKVLCGLFLPLSISEHVSLHCVPRKTVPYQEGLKVFREEGIWNYSTMLMREDLGVLMLGAREAVYALDMNDVSTKNAGVYWGVTPDKQRECTYKGKDAEVECRNYIRTLHTVAGDRMYVCGTNAFSPICDYMTYSDGVLTLEGLQEEGKGKCPFDPFQRYSSIMIGEDLYSATSINFLGSEPVVLRSTKTTLRTEFKSSWLNEPNFVYMDFVPESQSSDTGDDDKVYMFFSENAMEYDFYNKLLVSRVARVCKGDMGGQRTLQRKWTSFLKARLDCSVPGPSLPSIVQDVFLLKNDDWRKSVFYAVFTPQSPTSDVSAVCAYSTSDISHVFDEGKFKTPVTVETAHVKWVMFSGELPVPRPGACINNAAREQGMMRSLDLPDKTLQFIRDRPLMDEAVSPLMGRPLLVRKGAMFTRIAVDTVRALDGETYPVMFIGTENGFVEKAVNYAGEMFIIEEIRLYKTPEPIRTLRLSSSKGQLYAGSGYGVVQLPLSDCGRYRSCVDCILARDPYCAWDLPSDRCSPVPRPQPPSGGDMIQSLQHGDISQCPSPDEVTVETYTLVSGHHVKLQCRPDSNLAQVSWHFSGQVLHSDDKRYIYDGGLLILNASSPDAGRYTCDSVEQVAGRPYTKTMAVYEVQPRAQPGWEEEEEQGETTETPHSAFTPSPERPVPTQPIETPLTPQSYREAERLVGLKVAVVLLSLFLGATVAWNLKGRCRRFLPQKAGAGQGKAPSSDYVDSTRTTEQKLLPPSSITTNTTTNITTNSKNNNRAHVDIQRNGELLFSGRHVSSADGLGFINDESEI